MRIGYNTNGFAHHRLEDAITILAEIGYRSVAITLDYHALNPYASDSRRQVRRVAKLLERRDLHCVIETGSRFLLDPRRKHQPTLLDEEESKREWRRDFLVRSIELAEVLGADAVSLWSGALPPGLDDEAAMSRLADECRRLVDHAEPREVRLAFEPEPDMFVDTMARFAELHGRIGHPLFGLTLDVGHVHCLDDGRIGEQIEAWSPHLFNVHLEDMRRGIHEHLMFGEGEIDIAGVMARLRKLDYRLGVHVELSRSSHDAVEAATRAFAFLAETMDH